MSPFTLHPAQSRRLCLLPNWHKLDEKAMAAAMDDESLFTSLTLEPMPQQLGVRVAGDDWTGITSTKERRKLQNRLNQRAYSMYCVLGTLSVVVLMMCREASGSRTEKDQASGCSSSFQVRKQQ